MAVTSYGRNKNHDDEIKKKKTKRRPIIASAIAVRLLIKFLTNQKLFGKNLETIISSKHAKEEQICIWEPQICFKNYNKTSKRPENEQLKP